MRITSQELAAMHASRSAPPTPRAKRFTGPVAKRKRDARTDWTGGERVVYTITIPGTPIGKPRQTRRDVWAKRPCVMRYREWADRARECAAAVGMKCPAWRVESVNVVAYFVTPASRPEIPYNSHYRQKPDGDNILKAVCDALWTDDAGLGDLRVARRWTDSEPCVMIIVTAMAMPAEPHL
jgi:Holliday junction resolvase RusA-like endonuclease